MYNQEEKDNFFNAIESLKKYRRADLLDERGRNLLETLYTDLLPNEHILKKSIKENTTFLIGRKGTGKSTIFLRIEQELRKKDNFLPCYLDVKTIYESAQTEFINLDYLAEYLPQKTVRKYLIERSFLQSVLKTIANEINIRYDNWFERLKEILGDTRAKETKAKIENLKQRIEDNEILKEIEIPIIKNIAIKQKSFNENTSSSSQELKDSISGGIDAKGPSIKASVGDASKEAQEKVNSSELEENFSSIFCKSFKLKLSLKSLKIF